MPEVSIIMPARNAEALIGQSIESVLDGTFQDWELLVVDDGSTDETAAVVKRYVAADARVQYLRRGSAGSLKALNAALARIPLERPYLAFLESGHLWTPEKLDTQLAQLHESGTEAVFCTMQGDAPAVVASRFEGEAGVPGFIALKDISVSAMLCRRSVVETVGNFSETAAWQGLEAFGLCLAFLRRGYSIQAFPEKMLRPADAMIQPERDTLSDIRRELSVLSGVQFQHETADRAVRNRILELYRLQIDLLASKKDRKGVRAVLPALNRFLGNPRIGSALANMLFLPSGLYRKFAQWLLSSLMK